MPHTANVRIEAWAPTREECIAEAVRGLVDGFADTSRAPAAGTYQADFVTYSDDRLLADKARVIGAMLSTPPARSRSRSPSNRPRTARICA